MFVVEVADEFNVAAVWAAKPSRRYFSRFNVS